MINYLSDLTKKYPIISIEDGLDQSDWGGWKKLNQEIGNNIQIVGDDLTVTNIKHLNRAIDEGSMNSILIKLNPNRNNYRNYSSSKTGEKGWIWSNNIS